MRSGTELSQFLRVVLPSLTKVSEQPVIGVILTYETNYILQCWKILSCP